MLQKSLKTKDKLPDGFRDNTAIVSAVLKRKKLKPGIYLRTNEGGIIQANYSTIMTNEKMSEIFVDYKKERVLSEKFSASLEWPDIDFVYDSQLQTVFADRGRYSLKFIDELRDKSDLYLYYYLREEDSEYQITGYLDYLKTKNGGKDKVMNFGMDRLQKWQDVNKAKLSEDLYFKLIAISIIGMPLIFSEWTSLDQNVNLGKMPVMTAIISTEAEEHKIGIKGNHPPIYSLYIDTSSRDVSRITGA